MIFFNFVVEFKELCVGFVIVFVFIDVGGSMLLDDMCGLFRFILYLGCVCFGFRVRWLIMGVIFLFFVIYGLVMCSCVSLGFFFNGLSCGLRMLKFCGE